MRIATGGRQCAGGDCRRSRGYGSRSRRSRVVVAAVAVASVGAVVRGLSRGRRVAVAVTVAVAAEDAQSHLVTVPVASAEPGNARLDHAPARIHDEPLAG